MTDMFLAPDRDGPAFLDALARALPGRRIRLAPPEGALEAPYLVVGRPPEGLFARVRGLKLILSLNAGVEALLAAGPPGGVPIVKMADEGLRTGMAEWVLLQALAWRLDLYGYARDQAARLWSPRVPPLPGERRVAILGAGHLGLACAETLRAAGFPVVLFGRRARREKDFEVFAGSEGLRRTLTGADILVCLLPDAPEARGLVGREALGLLRAGALVVNAGRGSTLDDGALLEALASGRVGRAALDVFAQEPLAPDHPFWSHPQVSVWPHVSAFTRPETAAAAIAGSVARFEAGEPLPSRVDPQAGY